MNLHSSAYYYLFITLPNENVYFTKHVNEEDIKNIVSGLTKIFEKRRYL